MSNPATQNMTLNPRKSGVVRWVKPRTATQAATGASSKDAPSQKWARIVNRFVNEYAQMNSNVGTEKMRGCQLSEETTNKSVEATKAEAHPKVKAQTVAGEINPTGK